MRYESKDFIKSHRQWQESRESKKIVNGKSHQVNGCMNAANRNTSRFDRKFGQENLRYNDAGGSVQSNKIQEGDNSCNANQKDLSIPADFSKRELEQLVRIRKKQTQQKSSGVEDKTTTNVNSHEDHNEDICRQPFEVILAARNNVRQAYREKRLESPVELDSLIVSMIPNQMWFGDFFRESQGAVEKIQKRMLMDYSRENM